MAIHAFYLKEGLGASPHEYATDDINPEAHAYGRPRVYGHALLWQATIKTSTFVCRSPFNSLLVT